jgi:alpha-acetolactate decarboxylase
MKISILGKTLIIAFALFANIMSLFSQDSKLQKEKASIEGKCPSLIVTPSNQNVTTSSGTTSFTVASNVSWTSSSNQAWCTVTPSGTGDGTITATYQANTGAASRVAAITVSGSGVSDQVVTVTQLGSAPALIVTPINRDVISTSGTTSFGVASNIAWTALSSQLWCTVTPSGNGNGTITATYQANTEEGARVAIITVSGSGVSDQVVTVTQLGTASVLIVTPLNQNVKSSTGTTSFAVVSNITWTASSEQTWCTVTPSGTDNGTIAATYLENTEANVRKATITVKGPGVNDQVVTVTQSGTAPSLIVTPLNQNVASSSGTTIFEVASNIEWTSTSNQPWCTVTPTGNGNGTIIATYQPNTLTVARTATITVMGPGVSNQVVTVIQSGIPPTLMVTPLNQNVTSSSGMTSFDVTSNIDWTSSSDQLWCSVTSSGTGNGTITANYQANTAATTRVATITISGPGVSNQVVTLTQDELITISYSGSPWCPSEDVQEVSLSGSSGGTYSAQPGGLDINPFSGAITPGTSVAGYYTVKYTLEKSPESRILEASAEVAIYETVTPHIAIKWDDVLVCPNLDNSILSYQWFTGTTPISGATKQYYVTSKIQGIYSVEVVDKNNCKTMSDEISMGGTKSFQVYPNPVRNSFKIVMCDIPVGKIRIKINDIAGTEVMNLDTEKSDFEYLKEISTSNLENGIYFVQIIVNEVYLYSVKIMVIK